MRILRWFLLLHSIFLIGQNKTETFFYPDSIALDSLAFQNQENSFQEDDNLTLLGFDLFESSTLSNFGSPLLPLWWKPKQNIHLQIGDLLVQNNVPRNNFGLSYSPSFPQTKIIYSQTYSDGQKLNFIHRRRYNHGSASIDYSRLVSEGYLSSEKVINTRFKIEGNFYHPEIPFSSKWRIRTFKNVSEWNGGISNDSLFLSGTESNWELLPTRWNQLNSISKHIEINGNNEYEISDNMSLFYQINLSIDSMLYDDLQDDSLFYPSRTDSTSQITRAFNYSNHLLKLKHKINSDKLVSLGMEYQNLKYFNQKNRQCNIFGSLTSERLKNQFYFALGKGDLSLTSLNLGYRQKISILGYSNIFKIAYERNLPSWMNLNTNFVPMGEEEIYPTSYPQVIIDKYVHWEINITDKTKIQNTYHNIDGYNYFNESGRSSISEEKIDIFQCRIDHHLERDTWHWDGTVGYQFATNIAIPVPKLMFRQKIYWQGALFKEASISQIGIRLLFKSAHPGVSYAPLLGDFYINQLNATNHSLRSDLFINFQIQSLKVFLSYEHFNGLWQGTQYLLKPYPMAKPTFRVSLIWNFYD